MTSYRMGNTCSIRKIISALMAILMFVCSYLAVPAQVLADGLALQDAVRAYNAVNDFSGNTAMPYSSLMGEEEGLRGEATRTFRRTDGMSETVIYGSAVAYMTEEGYALIDNTLVKAGEGYANKASDFRVTFHQTTETEELVRLEAGGSLLSWFLGGFHFGEELTEELPVEEETMLPDTMEEDEPSADDTAVEGVPSVPASTEEPGHGTDIPENVPTADETPADTEEQPTTEETSDGEENVPAAAPAEETELDTNEEAPFTDTEEDDTAAEEDSLSDRSGIEETDTTTEETAGESAPAENPAEDNTPADKDTTEDEEDNSFSDIEDDNTTDTLPTEESVDAEEDPSAEDTTEETITEDATEEAITDETMLPSAEETKEENPILAELLQGLKKLHAKAEVTNHERVKGLKGEEADMQLRFPPELTSEAEYTDKELGISLRYVLSGKTLSEHVTLDRFPGKDFHYVTVITWDGEVKDNGDGTHTFLSAEGREAFRLGKPSMEDAAGEPGGEVRISLVPAGEGKWAYTVMPDGAWLKKAAYPVTIDPDFSAVFSGTVTDTYVDPDHPGQAHGSDPQLAAYVSGTMALLKIGDSALPALSSGDAVTYAALHMAKSNTDSGHLNAVVAGYRVTDAWDDGTDHAHMPAYENVPLTAGVSSRHGTYTEFDITGLVREWYAGTAEITASC